MRELQDLETLTINSLYPNDESALDLNPIEVLTKLRRLSLNNIVIYNLNFTSNMHDLEYLNIVGPGNGRPLDLSPLKNLKKLNSIIGLSYHTVPDWSPVAHVKNVAGRPDDAPVDPPPPEKITIKGVEYSTDLTSLDLSNQALTTKDLEPLKYMINLNNLNLYNTFLTDVSPLSPLVGLTSLTIDTSVTDISPLSGMSKLETLGIAGSYIMGTPGIDLKPIAACTNLIHLQAGTITPESFEVLKNFKQLKNLYVNTLYSENKMINIEAFRELQNLEVLTFQVIGLNNQDLIDLSPISELKKLRSLSIYNPQLKNLNILSNLVDLEILYFYGTNGIYLDLSPLKNLKNLQNLSDLSYYTITDWSPVAHVPNVVGRLDNASAPAN